MTVSTRDTRVKAEGAINRLRTTLADNYPGFELAESVERDAEELCRKVRKDLCEKRKSMHIDQAVLAEKLNLSQSSISKIERGKGDIGIKTIHRYSSALGMVPLLLFVPAPIRSMSGGEQVVPSNDVSAANEMVAAQEMFLRRVSEMIPALMHHKEKSA